MWGVQVHEDVVHSCRVLRRTSLTSGGFHTTLNHRSWPGIFGRTVGSSEFSLWSPSRVEEQLWRLVTQSLSSAVHSDNNRYQSSVLTLWKLAVEVHLTQETVVDQQLRDVYTKVARREGVCFWLLVCLIDVNGRQMFSRNLRHKNCRACFVTSERTHHRIDPVVHSSPCPVVV